MKSISMIVLVLSALGAASAAGQASSSRTAQLAALFSKHKHIIKDRHGAKQEKYKDVTSTPASFSELSSYAGHYDAGFGFTLELRLNRDNQLTGSILQPVTEEAPIARSFALEQIRIDGAILTATMITQGRREKFEGIFLNRTSRESPADPGQTTFGLGVVMSGFKTGGMNLDRLFYERR